MSPERRRNNVGECGQRPGGEIEFLDSRRTDVLPTVRKSWVAPSSRLFQEAGAKVLDQDKLTRISLLLGLFKALNILYTRKLADAWVQLPNSKR